MVKIVQNPHPSAGRPSTMSTFAQLMCICRRFEATQPTRILSTSIFIKSDLIYTSFGAFCFPSRRMRCCCCLSVHRTLTILDRVRTLYWDYSVCTDERFTYTGFYAGCTESSIKILNSLCRLCGGRCCYGCRGLYKAFALAVYLAVLLVFAGMCA